MFMCLSLCGYEYVYVYVYVCVCLWGMCMSVCLCLCLGTWMGVPLPQRPEASAPPGNGVTGNRAPPVRNHLGSSTLAMPTSNC